ncbi:PITH domain-containing protein NDAI_0K02060 [Naumovozyma dairenensis CBS 421]|uniref:PITH domain-containing protein n=1 Tax=Naumovozyma dairenensis (strain ATCC 10597 / BCRC 20456 / CBS 421 / NBRC 0211 / NRRL Y-12639) TaxID=1071378 RepID=G0WHY6_NAUDC|nr:hypothetical protein NDAI_0K02060 [Naumovozyma dairenensis CBS 421]CCD27397.1 hypothetical protein NDAI_0K02060 [Naumovozyma dairenensis CBS 421]
MFHNCENEHFDHGHNHNHDHSPVIETNPHQSLYRYIDTNKIRCLNLIPSDTSDTQPIYKFFLKTQDEDEQNDITRYIQSDTDCQSIIHIPFISNCKVFSILLKTNGDSPSEELSSIKTIHLIKNYDKNIDFDTITNFISEKQRNRNIMHTIEHLQFQDDDPERANELIEYHLPLKIFQNNCHSLTIFIENNWSQDEDDLNRIYYLEIRGEFINNLSRINDSISLKTINYEKNANPLDHEKLESSNNFINLGQ